MNQKLIAVLTVVLLGPCFAFQVALAQSGLTLAHSLGEAHDLETGELIYRETHCKSEDGQSHEVIYQHRDGEMMAYKLLDYASGKTSPSFVQHNIHADEKVSVTLDGDKLTMSILGADAQSAKQATETLVAGPPLVIDAGFDEFIRANWDRLNPGDKRRFQFPVASRASLVELQIKPISCTYGDGSDRCFRLEMSSWLFRMLVAPIELGYDPDRRLLTRYRGLSNIEDNSGKGMVVDIRYRYQSIPEQACGSAARHLAEE